MASEAPMHLPILLQVLLSQTHRLHALVLLRRYLALGPRLSTLLCSWESFPTFSSCCSPPLPRSSRYWCAWASIIGFDTRAAWS